MRVLLTGGAGFVGGNVLAHLLRDGHDVAVVDVLNDTPTPRAQKLETLASCARIAPFEQHELDVRDHVSIGERVGRVDAIVHLAALSGVAPSMGLPASYASINVQGTAAMLELARHFDVRRVVFASSSSVYGDARGAAQDEGSPAIEPESPYGASKRASELFASAWVRGSGIPVTALRFFTVYGPGQRPDMAVGIFMRRVSQGLPVHIRDGASRDFVYVEDVARAVGLSLVRDTQGFEVFNVGTGVPTTLADLVTAIGDTLGQPPIIGGTSTPWAGDVQHTHADTRHAALALGFRASVGLADGLRGAWEWQRTRL